MTYPSTKLPAGNPRQSVIGRRLRVLQAGVFVPAAVGMMTGFYFAGREISSNAFYSQGLWRTSLWLACHHSILGAAAGVGAGIFLVLWVVCRRKPASAVPPSDRSPATDTPTISPVGEQLRLAPMLSALLATAVLFMPENPPDILGISSRWGFGAAILLCWGLASTTLLSRPCDNSRFSDLFEAVWTAVVWLAYAVALSHLWARVEPGVVMAMLAGGGLLAAIGVWLAFHRPIERLIDMLGRHVWAPSALPRICWLSTAFLGAGVLLWSVGWAVRLEAQNGGKRERPNLIVIALDTVRYDRVSVLSKPTQGPDLTPKLRKRLAPHGTVFTRAYSQAPWTLPAFASVLTGLYPDEHGAHIGTRQLGPRNLTLAEVLREAGYRTMAIVSGAWVNSDAGMLQGFNIRDESQVLPPDAITSAELTNRALALLATHGDEPFFLFVHYFDPHWVYNNHEESDLAPNRSASFLPAKLKAVVDPMHFSRDQLATIKALYAEEIAFTDLHVGRLLAWLDEHRLWDSTCVVLVADHGEEFLDHGRFQHGHSVFNELVHVPLIVADPSRESPASVDYVVETRWLFGTILDMLGISRSPSHANTPSVFAPPHDREYYARSSMYRNQSCLIGRQYKLIKGFWRPRHERAFAGEAGKMAMTGKRPLGTALLFDLDTDPSETRDLSASRPELARELLSSLNTMNSMLCSQIDGRAETAGRLNRDQRRRLEALGYL